jgi:hypothetical protein
MKDYGQHAQKAWTGLIANAIAPTLAQQQKQQQQHRSGGAPTHSAWTTPLVDVLAEDAVTSQNNQNKQKTNINDGGQSGGFIRSATRPLTPGLIMPAQQTGGFIRSATRPLTPQQPPQQPPQQKAGKRMLRRRHTRRSTK